MDVRNDTAKAELADFLDHLIHDMREPLRSIGVFSEVLQENGSGSGEEAHHALDEIHAGTAKIRMLLEGLSGYATALREPRDAGRPASVQSALTIVLGELDPQIRASGATITADNLPLVAVNFDRLLQLLRILLDNALRFRSEAAPVIHLSAESAEPGMATIRMEDNGIGIAAEDCAAVFKPFLRVEGRKYGGVGMGLPAAKQIVEAYGGSIRMEPGATRGAVCVFTLPEA